MHRQYPFWAISGHCAATLNAEGATFRWPLKRTAFYFFSSSSIGFFFLLRRSSRRSRRFAPATLTAEPGLPTRASASVAVITAAGTTRLTAAAKPRSEKAARREIISDLIFSLITTSGLISKASRKGRRQFDADQKMPSLLMAVNIHSECRWWVKSGYRACGLQPAVAIISLKGPPASDVSGPLGVS